MNKYKLVLSSIKNQIHIYSIYIVSLIFSFTFYLTFINLSSASIELAKTNDANTKMYTLVVYGIGLLIAALITFLINYVQTLLVNARSKELAVYRLISFSSKELRKYLLVEQLLINLFSFVIGLVLSILLSIVLLNNFNDVVESMFSMQLNMSLSISTLIYELFSVVAISLVITFFANRKIERKELIDLLNTKHALPDEDSEKNSILNAVIVFATWIGLMYVLFEQFARLKTSVIILILIIYIISIFTIYNVIAKIVVKIIPKRVYYSNANSFTTSIIKRKLNANALSMAFVTILILISTYTVMLGVINTKFIGYLAQYDDVKINTNYNTFSIQNQDQNFSVGYNVIDQPQLYFPDEGVFDTISEYSYNKFAAENNLATIDLTPNQAVVIASSDVEPIEHLTGYQYDPEVDADDVIYDINHPIDFDVVDTIPSNGPNDWVYIVVDDSYHVDWTKYVDDLYQELQANDANPRILYDSQDNFEVYNNGVKIQSPFAILSQSNANQYLHAMDIDQQFKLNDNQLGYIGPTAYSQDDNQQVVTDHGSYQLSQVISDPSLKTLGFGYYVVNDQAYSELAGYHGETMYVNYTDKYDQKFWEEIKNDENFHGWVAFATDVNSDNLMMNVIFSGALIFISLILLLLLITMIGVQVNIDSIETKEQFKSLSRVGYSHRNIHSIINRITLIYFIIPLIVGILNIAILYIVFTRYLSVYTTTSFIFSTGAVSSSELLYIGLFMLIIYIVYCILVNISYKRVIDKNFE